MGKLLFERGMLVNDNQPYRTVIRHSIIALSPSGTYTLGFDQIGDAFPPGWEARLYGRHGCPPLQRGCSLFFHKMQLRNEAFADQKNGETNP